MNTLLDIQYMIVLSKELAIMRRHNHQRGQRMTTDKSYHLPWPGADDRTLIENMLRDPQSEHWTKCREYVEKLVHKRATNIPRDFWDDIIQEAMIKIDKSLPTFQYRCSLKTWLFGIVGSCIIDDHRKITRIKTFIALPTDFSTSHEDGEANDVFSMHLSRTTEEDFMMIDELKQAIAALREYITTHKKPERNEQILSMVLDEDRSLEEAAKAVGCSAAVAGYVVRSAQRYVRDKLGRR